MINCHQLDQLRQQVQQWRQNNESIALVPTMGNLHAGHLSLVKLAKQKARRVVVSIYVNPLQFLPSEDFGSYPRTLDDDISQLKAEQVDMVFTPDTSLMYPLGEAEQTRVTVPAISDILEGEFRPGFFTGVATVVLKLFNMVQPDVAVFGEKDFQQLQVIKRLVADLNLPIDIFAGDTVREDDGLAMSSRNAYLDTAERESSAALSAAIWDFRNGIEAGETIDSAQSKATEKLETAGFSVDYLTIRETSALKKVSTNALKNGSEYAILVAARLGKTRLIDNLRFHLRMN